MSKSLLKKLMGSRMTARLFPSQHEDGSNVTGDDTVMILTYLEESQNTWLKKMKKLWRREKSGDDSGGWRQTHRGQGGLFGGQGGNSAGFLGMMKYQSIQNVAQTLAKAEADLAGIGAGIKLTDIAPGYSLDNFGTTSNGNTPTNDAKYIKALSNSVAASAQIGIQISAAERSEASIMTIDALGNNFGGFSGDLTSLLFLSGNFGSLIGGTSVPYAAPKKVV